MNGIITKSSTNDIGGASGNSVLLEAQPAVPETLEQGIHKIMNEEPFRRYADGDTYYGKDPDDLKKRDVRENDHEELIWTTPFDDYLAGIFSYCRLSRLFDYLCGTADQKRLRIAEFQPGEVLDSAFFFSSRGCCVDVYEDVSSAITQLESLRERIPTTIRKNITINPQNDSVSARHRYDMALCVAPWPGFPIHLTNLLDDCVLKGGFAMVYTECDVKASPQEWLPIYNRTLFGMVMASDQFFPLNNLVVSRRI